MYFYLKNALSLNFLFLLFSCAGMMRQPLPIEKRTSDYNIDSAKKKLEIYQAVKFWLPTSLNSHNQLIQAEDKDSGSLAGTAYIPCTELPGSSMAAQSIEFQYKAVASDKRLKLTLYNQRIYVPEDKYASKEDNIFNDDSQVKGVKTCLDRIVASLGDSIK